MYDIVIVSHDKDFNKIKYVVEHAEKNLDDFDSIHLILVDKPFDELDIVRSKTIKPVYVHKEQDVLPLDFSKVHYRPNWIYQILLKMFQNVTENDNFLILESDGIVNKKLEFFQDGKTIFYLGLNHPVHQPYFNYNNLLNIRNKYHHSLISEVMMYDKKYIKELLKNCGCENRENFIDKYIYNNLSNSCYPADYEMYGNFMYNFHSDKIKFIHYKYFLHGNYNSTFSNETIEKVINEYKNYDYISFHTWI